MARKAMIEKDAKRLEKAKRYHVYRKELRQRSTNMSLSIEERDEAQRKLQSLPRDTSMTRVTYRCHLTGRARGNLRKFGLSRIAFRELASSGKIPGVTKSSW